MVRIAVSQIPDIAGEKAADLARFLDEWEPRFIRTNADGTEAGVSQDEASECAEACAMAGTPCPVKLVWVRLSDGMRVDAPPR